MKDSAQVIIIGGGIIGCSAAYHLISMGWKDVVIVEEGHLTSGGYGYRLGKPLSTVISPSKRLVQMAGIKSKFTEKFSLPTMNPTARSTILNVRKY